MQKATTTKGSHLQPYGEEALESLKSGLQIDKLALDEALEAQPQSFWHVCEQLALWTSRRDQAKQELQIIEAQVDAETRDDMSKAGERVTEKQVEAAKIGDARVIAAQQEFLRLNHTVMLFTGMREAYSQRGYVIRELVNLHLASYYSENSARGSERGLKDQRVDHVRAEQQRMRKEAPLKKKGRANE